RAPDFNRRARVPVRLQISGSPVCDATLRLFGSHGHVVASARFVRLKRGRSRVTLSRLRTFVAGRYHLETTGLDRYGEPTRVDTDVSGRLTRPPRKKKRKRR
ncbi:MAG: hypothetical protein QOI80_3727, partial [Solirubrobacteraceae bacterium]|nr:hypothetical protein [Solirubrobacteraceae bacterium]